MTSALQTLFENTLSQIRKGDVASAVASCQRLGTNYPRFADGWYVSSVLAQRLGNAAKALDFVERALALEPARALFLVRKATVLRGLSRVEEAVALIGKVETGAFESVQLSAALATYYTQAGDHDGAIVHYRAIFAADPDDMDNLFNLAATERFVGNLAASEAAYSLALKKRPANCEALYIRSGLRKQTPGANNIVELQEALNALDGRDAMGLAYVHYALGKEYEDIGDYPRSFDHVSRGAKARRGMISYDVKDDVSVIEAIRSHYPKDVINGLSGRGSSNSEPIFILGLPRTGTTLVERIIASHSSVDSAGELDNFAVEMTTAIGSAGRSKLQMVEASRALDFNDLGNRYVASTRPYTGRKDHFTDKMPLNYLYCGLIASALPNAAIIELVRHPLDTCYAMFKQIFTSAYPFSYDLDEIVTYYLAYLRLMKHWHDVMPGRIHRVFYERLVEDQEGETASLLAHCGLEFERSCLAFEKNASACTTASATQVREKIYSSAVERWRHFAAQLGPARDRIVSSPEYQGSGLPYSL